MQSTNETIYSHIHHLTSMTQQRAADLQLQISRFLTVFTSESLQYVNKQSNHITSMS